jgi:hypothetical protein
MTGVHFRYEEPQHDLEAYIPVDRSMRRMHDFNTEDKHRADLTQ